jgi:threonine/homoserine/homoserine lactone efflux protein
MNMSRELTVAFMGFAVASFYTPGPNNIMLLSSGLNYGFRRTLPHIAGITLGFAFLVLVVGLGMGAVFAAHPSLQTVLRYLGAAYLFYLALAIALAKPSSPGKAKVSGRPMTFVGAALFQWINVKGWVIVAGTITAYAAIAPYPWNMIVLAALSLLVGLTSSTSWAFFGSAMQPIVSSSRALRIFNVLMALLLAASLYPVLTEG